MGFFDKIADFINGSIGDAVDSVNTGIFNSRPYSCAYCIMCRRILKELPSGMKVYIFTCPKKDSSNYFPSTLPSLPANETDEEKQRDYIEKFYNYYTEHSNFIAQSHAADSYALSLCNRDLKPIDSEKIENLDFCPDVYYCDQYRPFLSSEGYPSYYYRAIDSYGDGSPITAEEYDNMSAEDQLQITGRTTK